MLQASSLEPAFSIMPVIQVGTGVCIRFHLVHCLLGFSRIHEQEGQSDECWDMKFAVRWKRCERNSVLLAWTPVLPETGSSRYPCAALRGVVWMKARSCDKASDLSHPQGCPLTARPYTTLTVGHEYQPHLTGPEGVAVAVLHRSNTTAHTFSQAILSYLCMISLGF